MDVLRARFQKVEMALRVEYSHTSLTQIPGTKITGNAFVLFLWLEDYEAKPVDY